MFRSPFPDVFLCDELEVCAFPPFVDIRAGTVDASRFAIEELIVRWGRDGSRGGLIIRSRAAGFRDTKLRAALKLADPVGMRHAYLKIEIRS